MSCTDLLVEGGLKLGVSDKGVLDDVLLDELRLPQTRLLTELLLGQLLECLLLLYRMVNGERLVKRSRPVVGRSTTQPC